MRKSTFTKVVLSFVFLFATLIIGGYTNAKAGDYQYLEISRLHQTFDGNLVNDKGVSRPVSIAVTGFLQGGELAKIIFVDKGKTYYLVGAFIDKCTMEAYLPYGAKLVCSCRSNGDTTVSYAADGTLHRVEIKSS